MPSLHRPPFRQGLDEHSLVSVNMEVMMISEEVIAVLAKTLILKRKKKQGINYSIRSSTSRIIDFKLNLILKVHWGRGDGGGGGCKHCCNTALSTGTRFG